MIYGDLLDGNLYEIKRQMLY